MSKLLKYDFKSFIFNHVALILALLVNTLIVIVTKAIIPLVTDMRIYVEFIHAIFTGIFFLTLIILPIMTFVMVISRYKRKVLGDEAYLTHTLPVSKNDILLATSLNAIIYFLIDITVMLAASLTIFGYQALIAYFGLLNDPNVIVVIIFILLVPTMVMTYLYQFLLAFTMGYSHETNKVKNTIVYGVGLYLLNQVIGFLIIGLSFLLILTNGVYIINYTFILILVAYIGLLVLTYSIIKYRLKNKLNLE